MSGEGALRTLSILDRRKDGIQDGNGRVHELHIDLSKEVMGFPKRPNSPPAAGDDIKIDPAHILPEPEPIDRTAFRARQFDVEAYLASQKHISLESLRGELRGHLQTLKEELLDLINQDYQDFISLGVNLRGVDAKLVALRAPLIQVGSKAQVIKDQLAQYQAQLETMFAQRKALAQTKVILQTFVHMDRRLGRLSRLLQSVNAQNSLNDIVQMSGLERAAIEFTTLQAQVTRLPSSAFSTVVRERLQMARQSLVETLARELKGLRARLGTERASNECLAAMKVLLNNFQRLEALAAAEDVLRAYVHDLAKAMMTPADGTLFEGSSEFSALFGNLQTLAHDEVALLRSAMHKTTDVNQGEQVSLPEQLYCNSVVTAILSAVDTCIGKSLFSVARTGTFHQNFTISMNFVQTLESNLPSLAGRSTFRDHPAVQAFHKKWQLQVYFQLRLKEVIAKTEAILLNNVTIRVAENTWREREKGKAILAPTRSIGDALLWCWSPNVYLKALCHRSWRLNLQLVKRYVIWIKSALEIVLEPAKIKNDLNKSQSSISRSLEEDEDLKLAQMTIAIHDVKFIRRHATTALHSMPQWHSDVIDSEMKQNFSGTLSHTVAPLHKLEDSIASHVTALITKRCTDQLLLVRSITGQYRHTKKSRPTAPSYFIPNILKPLRTYLNEVGSILKDDDTEGHLLQWTRIIIDEVSRKYAVVTADILASIKKAEDSLRRFQRGRKTGFSLFGNDSASESTSEGKETEISDEDKIRAQMLLDVHAFIEGHGAFGLESGELEGQIILRDAVEGK